MRRGAAALTLCLWLGCAADQRRDGATDAQIGVDVEGDEAPDVLRPPAPIDAGPPVGDSAAPDAGPEDATPGEVPDAAAPAPDAAAPLPVCDCFVRAGWCAEGVLEEAAARGCRVPLAEANPGALVACDDGAWAVGEACAHGCTAHPPGTPDACAPPPLPACECFVRAAWCGEGAAAEGLSRDPPCRVPLGPEHADDLLGCDGDTWVVREACEFGCFARPAGVPDHCNRDPDAAPTPQEPGWAACDRRGLLSWGLHPEASDRLRCAGVAAGAITQTIGDAAASAGYHAIDGRVNGEPYCAAVDLSVRGLSNAQIRDLLRRLGQNGFAAWYRQPGHDGWPAHLAPHIHAVFTGVRMKSQLRGQVRDFLNGLNGLTSHLRYEFWRPAAEVLRITRLLFSRHYAP